MIEINEDIKKFDLCCFCFYVICFIFDILLNSYYLMVVIWVNFYNVMVLI